MKFIDQRKKKVEKQILGGGKMQKIYAPIFGGQNITTSFQINCCLNAFRFKQQ